MSTKLENKRKLRLLLRLSAIYHIYKNQPTLRVKDLTALGFSSITTYNILNYLVLTNVATRENSKYKINWERFYELLKKLEEEVEKNN